LPNPKLLGCKLADCSQLRIDKNIADNAIFPKQLLIDSNQRCIYGMQAFYDSSVSIDDLATAINQRYSKWPVPQFEKGPIRIWRVESEKFSIQLTSADEKDKKRKGIEPGTKQLIFITFGGRSACAESN
jgi:hypothetical protein